MEEDEKRSTQSCQDETMLHLLSQLFRAENKGSRFKCRLNNSNFAFLRLCFFFVFFTLMFLKHKL